MGQGNSITVCNKEFFFLNHGSADNVKGRRELVGAGWRGKERGERKKK